MKIYEDDEYYYNEFIRTEYGRPVKVTIQVPLNFGLDDIEEPLEGRCQDDEL